MTLPGPSRTIIVEPVEKPAPAKPLPVPEPAPRPERTPEPKRKPDKKPEREPIPA
jgi:hypothetical protein